MSSIKLRDLVSLVFCVNRKSVDDFASSQVNWYKCRFLLSMRHINECEMKRERERRKKRWKRSFNDFTISMLDYFQSVETLEAKYTLDSNRQAQKSRPDREHTHSSEHFQYASKDANRTENCEPNET